VRVRKPAAVVKGPPRRKPGPPPSRLPADSLGLSLLLAARVIAAVRAGQSLTQALRPLSDAAPAARAAAQDVAYGTLRRYGCGEFILARLLTKPLSHTETEALLLAALFRLHTRPEAAYMVVDQAVAAAGEMTGGVFKGLVNGLLRSYLRQRESLAAAMAGDDEAAQQHPAWWLARLRRAYPEHWQEIVAAGNGPPPMTLRVNRRRATSEAYAARLLEAGSSARQVAANALLLAKPVTVDALPGFADGLVSIQDAGAQRAAQLLLPVAGERILDACAAPGGKAAHLLEAADIDLLALDIDAHAHPAHRRQPTPPRSRRQGRGCRLPRLGRLVGWPAF
jgi:16S rRNA (cytosine967-C5)-methyltransferase